MNQYKNEPKDFKPSKLYFENEDDMMDEFCMHCCGYIPKDDGPDFCCGCNEIDETMSDYKANFDNDRNAISKIIDSQLAIISELKEKLRWIPFDYKDESIPKNKPILVELEWFRGKKIVCAILKRVDYDDYYLEAADDGSEIDHSLNPKRWMEIPGL